MPATRPAASVPTAPICWSTWRARRAPAAGIYGAKITGGGSGGTVAILAREDAADRVRHIAAEYAERTGREPYVFEGTSDGAAITGATRDSSTD